MATKKNNQLKFSILIYYVPQMNRIIAFARCANVPHEASHGDVLPRNEQIGRYFI
jgi:hypothetical protein